MTHLSSYQGILISTHSESYSCTYCQLGSVSDLIQVTADVKIKTDCLAEFHVFL